MTTSNTAGNAGNAGEADRAGNAGNVDPAVRAELARLRESIDNIDAAVVHMLAERFKCTQQVGHLKAAHRMHGRQLRPVGPDDRTSVSSPRRAVASPRPPARRGVHPTPG